MTLSSPLRAALIAGLLGATVAVYLPSIDGQFLFDDAELLRDRRVLDPGSVGPEGWLGGGRSLLALTFAANHAAVGLDTRGWHLTNVSIHLAAVVLAWAFARKLLRRAGFSRPDGPALAAAAFFALHPLQTEAVSYITQRAESLASALYLVGLLALLAFDDALSPRGRWALALGAMAALVLGLTVKPIIATLPATWLLLAVLVPTDAERDSSRWRCVVRRTPLALALLTFSAGAARLELAATAGSETAGLEVPRLPPALYLATQLRVIPTYLRLLVWPAGQCADWPFVPSESFLEPAVLGGGALLAVVVVAAILFALRAGDVTGDRRAALRVGSFGLLFFVLTLAPSSSLIPLLDPLAEHRVYLAALGPFLAATTVTTLALRFLSPAWGTAGGAALSVAILACAGFATARRNEVWTTNLALWTDAAQKEPGKSRVHENLGEALYEVGDSPKAIDHFVRALELSADNSSTARSLLRNIVVTLLSMGKVAEARTVLVRALTGIPVTADALVLLATVEFTARQPDEAERYALRALSMEPGNSEAWRYLGLARVTRGDLAGAREALRAAASNGPDTPLLLRELGAVEEALGDQAAACSAYARAALAPGHAAPVTHAREALERLGCR